MEDLITKFVTKQRFVNVAQIDDDTVAFDGYHISIEDIEHDMENNVTAGLIRLYYGSNEKISYRKWLCFFSWV